MPPPPVRCLRSLPIDRVRYVSLGSTCTSRLAASSSVAALRQLPCRRWLVSPQSVACVPSLGAAILKRKPDPIQQRLGDLPRFLRAASHLHLALHSSDDVSVRPVISLGPFHSSLRQSDQRHVYVRNESRTDSGCHPRPCPWEVDLPGWASLPPKSAATERPPIRCQSASPWMHSARVHSDMRPFEGNSLLAKMSRAAIDPKLCDWITRCGELSHSPEHDIIHSLIHS